MNITRNLLFLLINAFITSSLSFAEKYTLSGFMSDSESGEKLIGASIFIPESLQGTSTNNFGYFSITLEEGEYEVVFSYVGFSSEKRKIKLSSDQQIQIELSSTVSLSEIVVTEKNSTRVEEQTQMSSIKIDVASIKNLPVMFGEVDVLKIIQLLPGVQSSEGSSGFYVRGGGPDQNLILLDGVPVYNASHLFGFFSVFNADALNSVELIKGGFAARYGGRLSSVLDIKMKEGNLKKFEGEASIGLISSKISFGGPIIKNKTSFIISARRTYLDVLTRPLIKLATSMSGLQGKNVAGYYFYDLNFKINHQFSSKSRLFLSTYFGKDRFYSVFSDSYRFDNIDYEDKLKAQLLWGNAIAALRWNYIITPKLFVNSTVTNSNYKFLTSVESEQSYTENDIAHTDGLSAGFNSGIYDVTFKTDFDYTPNPNHYIKFGVGDIYHTFSPGVQQIKFTSGEETEEIESGSKKIYSHEFYTYVEDDLKVGKRMKMNLGVYATVFKVRNTLFPSIQPRFSSRYLLTPRSSIKLSYAEMAQFLHLLTNPTIGLPTDLWVPATDKVKPEYSKQVAMGYARSIGKQLEFTTEAYYKTMKNLVEYGDGTSFFGTDQQWEDKVESGRGWSYGTEVMLEKKIGKITGWLGYTLSWTNRQFENINFGKVFPYKYDRRHDIGIALTYKRNERIDYGIVWVYGTGNATTLGLERYMANNLGRSYYTTEIQRIESRNNYRMPSYHRMDLGINFRKDVKYGKRTISLGIYNLYNRQNPFFLLLWNDFQGNTTLKQVSIFPLIPSVAYSLKF